MTDYQSVNLNFEPNTNIKKTHLIPHQNTEKT